MQCTDCAQPLRAGVAFCTSCGSAVAAPTAAATVTATVEAPTASLPGTPPRQSVPPRVPTPSAPSRLPTPISSTRHGRRLPALAISLVLALAIVGGGIALASHHDAVAAPPSGDLVPTSDGSSVVAPVVDPPSSQDDEYSGEVSSPTTTDQAQPTDEVSAKAALDAEVANDRSSAEQLIEEWVPQLSSKRPGLVADGITYDYLHIWQNFQDLQAQYQNVLLIWSGNYVSFKSKNFYVTIVEQAYPDGDSANQWCDEAGIDVDDCYAKLLSHTVGPTGTTVLRQ